MSVVIFTTTVTPREVNWLTQGLTELEPRAVDLAQSNSRRTSERWLREPYGEEESRLTVWAGGGERKTG